jgi:phage regulator Rha-like protein
MEGITTIQNKIYEIRGERVMLDFDLAELYGTETKRLKEAVKRNSKRFPPDFIFELTQDEFAGLRSQIATSNTEATAKTNTTKGSLKPQIETSKRGGTRYMPFAFTEHGVTMLASVLNSEKAIKMNIAIVRAFITLRSLVVHNHEILNQLMELRDRIGEHDTQLNQIYDALENLLDKQATIEKWEQRQKIGFKKK